MAIQSRFALLLTLCLFATSGLAAPVPGAPAVNPDTNELVGQNTITALGKPVNVPRAGLSAASLPFLINPDTLPVAPAHGAGSKRDPRYTNDLHASSPAKVVQVESDHQGQKAPVSSRAATAIPQHVDGAKLSRRHDDTTTSFSAPLNAVKGSSHGYSEKRDDITQSDSGKKDETMQATAPGNVAVQDHKYQERSDNAAPAVDAVKLGTRKNDETTEVAAPMKAVDFQDHKYADSPTGGPLSGLLGGLTGASSSGTPSSPFALLHAGKMQSRKHDQKNELDIPLGGELDGHSYSDDRRRDDDSKGSELKVGQVQARKHDETMHLGTPLGGALDYHPYSDNRKRSKDQTVHEDAPLGGGVGYHRYGDKRQYSSDGPSPSMVPFDESTLTYSARSATETGM